MHDRESLMPHVVLRPAQADTGILPDARGLFEMYRSVLDNPSHINPHANFEACIICSKFDNNNIGFQNKDI